VFLRRRSRTSSLRSMPWAALESSHSPRPVRLLMDFFEKEMLRETGVEKVTERGEEEPTRDGFLLNAGDENIGVMSTVGGWGCTDAHPPIAV
jgi:hypothetical protein